MYRLWKYAENTFEVITRGSFKLMHILITDHFSRCTQLSGANPGNQTFLDALQDATQGRDGWQASYSAWLTCKGFYKGATAAFYNALEDLGSLKIPDSGGHLPAGD